MMGILKKTFSYKFRRFKWMQIGYEVLVEFGITYHKLSKKSNDNIEVGGIVKIVS